MKDKTLDDIRTSFDLFALTEYENKFVAITKDNNNKTIKKIKSVTPEWLKGRIEKWQDGTFKNLRSIIRDNLDLGGRCYATSFGFSYDCMLVSKKDFEKDVEKLKSFLDNHGIEYRNELSDAGWVYRFRLSKSEDNINRIKELES